MNKTAIIFTVLITPAMLIASSAVVPEKETQKIERLEEICEQLIEEGFPNTIVVGPHIKAGKAAEWVINNVNRADGWSFTGYASLKINNEGNKSRWKIGIINGELDSTTHNDLCQRREPNYTLLEEWNQRKTKEMVFGISFIKEF
jgi:hypothetical protein